MSMKRWGILGTGWMAEMFVSDLLLEEGAVVYAVGSRSLTSAESFASRFNIPNAYGSYNQLVNDPDVDIVYIASPHPFHLEHVKLSLKAGKPTLCEKPFAINARQVKQMTQLANQHNIFLMEAMWSKFTPVMVELRRLLSERVIGEVMLLEANFGFIADRDPNKRWFNKALGGGALLDIGIYPIALASMIFGKPKEVVSLCALTDQGIDETSSYLFKYNHGAMANLSVTFNVETNQEAWLTGTHGQIRIPKSWWMAETLEVIKDGKITTIACPKRGLGYGYQATAVMDALDRGKKECEIMPLQESLDIMQTMDRLRNQWNVVYPGE